MRKGIRILATLIIDSSCLDTLVCFLGGVFVGFVLVFWCWFFFRDWSPSLTVACAVQISQGHSYNPDSLSLSINLSRGDCNIVL